MKKYTLVAKLEFYCENIDEVWEQFNEYVDNEGVYDIFEIISEETNEN